MIYHHDSLYILDSEQVGKSHNSRSFINIVVTWSFRFPLGRNTFIEIEKTFVQMSDEETGSSEFLNNVSKQARGSKYAL